MLPIEIYTPDEIASLIAEQAKQLRLSKNMSRKTLSTHSGVSEGSIQRFEQTGKVSLDKLLKIAHALSATETFLSLFELPEPQTIKELKDREKRPKRGRL